MKTVKFKLPFTEEEIEEAKARVEACKLALKEAEGEFHSRYYGNVRAKEADDVRKARIVTPSMRAVLSKLADGFLIDVSCYYGNRRTIQLWKANDGYGRIRETVNSALYERLYKAGYIREVETNNYCSHRYVISKAGHAALNASK